MYSFLLVLRSVVDVAKIMLFYHIKDLLYYFTTSHLLDILSFNSIH